MREEKNYGVLAWRNIKLEDINTVDIRNYHEENGRAYIELSYRQDDKKRDAIHQVATAPLTKLGVQDIQFNKDTKPTDAQAKEIAKRHGGAGFDDDQQYKILRFSFPIAGKAGDANIDRLMLASLRPDSDTFERDPDMSSLSFPSASRESHPAAGLKELERMASAIPVYAESISQSVPLETDTIKRRLFGALQREAGAIIEKVARASGVACERAPSL